MLTRVRRALSWALVVVSAVGAIALDDPTPVLVVLALAFLLLPRSDWKQRRQRRMRIADYVALALALALAALGLTLLMPDGLLRWVVIGAILIAYAVWWPLLDRAARDGEPRQTVKDAP